jgi:hypothetical protein
MTGPAMTGPAVEMGSAPPDGVAALGALLGAKELLLEAADGNAAPSLLDAPSTSPSPIDAR